MRDREGEKKEEGKRKEGDKEMREYWIGCWRGKME